MIDPVARSDEFDKRLGDSHIVQALVNTGKTNRRIIRWLAVSVALDIGLSVAMIFIAIGAQHTAETATSAQTQTRLQCEAGNEARSAQLQLWTYVLTLSSQHETKRQKKQAVQFRHYIQRVFAQRDCDNPEPSSSAGPLPATPTPQSVSTPAPTVVTAKPTYFVTEPPRRSSSPSPSPSPSPRTTHSHSPSPSPSPSRSCIVHVDRICVPPR